MKRIIYNIKSSNLRIEEERERRKKRRKIRVGERKNLMEAAFSIKRSIISEEFDSCVLPTRFEISLANGQLFLVFEDSNKVSLSRWIQSKDKKLSNLLSFKLLSQLLEATLKKISNWNLADQIAYALSQFVDSTPVIIKSSDNKEFKDFIAHQYFLSLDGKFVFSYPPDMLVSAIKKINPIIKRESNSDVWSVGVLLLVLTGFSNENISMLMDNNKKKEFLRTIKDEILQVILSRIFEDHPTRRISLEQLLKYFYKYSKELEEQNRKNDENNCVKAECQSDTADIKNQNNIPITQWKKKKWYGHIMKQLPEKLNLEEAKQLNTLVIKCLDSVVQVINAKEKELKGQTKPTRKAKDEMNIQEYNKSWKNVLSDANCFSIGRFFSSAGEKAKEIGEDELSKELFEAQEQLVQTYLNSGQWDNVKKLTEDILLFNKNNIIAQLIQIEYWMQTKNYEMGFQFIQNILAEQPKNITIAFQQGRIAKKKKDFYLAEMSFKKCLEIVKKLEDPIIFNSETFSKDNFKSKILFEIGLSQKEQSKEAESEESFNDCLKLNPNHPEAYFQLGLIYQKQGKKDQQKESYQNYQRINSDTIEEFVRLFEKQELSEKGILQIFENSLFMLNIKLKLNVLCDNFQGFFGSLGITYYKLRNLKYATCCFKISTLINEKQQFNDNVHITYGKCLMFSMKYQEASEIFMQFLERKDFLKISKLKFYIGICRLKQGQTCLQDLKSAFLTLKESYFVPAAQQLLIALLNKRVNEVEKQEIVDLIEKTLNQKNPDIWGLLSQVNLEYGSHPFQSMYYVEKALQKNRFLVNQTMEDQLSKEDELKIGCLVQEARIWFQLGNTKRALQSIISVRETIKIEGIITNENKELSDNGQCYEEGNAILLNDLVKVQREGWNKVDWRSEADVLLAEIYFQNENDDKAMDLIKSVEERNQFDCNINRKLTHIKALILLRQSKIYEGMALLRDNQKFESSLIELVKLLFEQGNAKEARELYETNIVSAKQSSRIQEIIGDLEFEARNYCVSNDFYLRYQRIVIAQNEKLKLLEPQRKGLSSRKVELNPDVLARLGQGLCLQKKYKESEQILETCLKVSPIQAKGLKWMGINYLLRKDFLKAKHFFKSLIQITEDQAGGYFLLSQCYLSQNDYKCEGKYLKIAFKLNPNHYKTLKALETYHLRNKQSIQAKQYFDRAEQIKFSMTIKYQYQFSLLALIRKSLNESLELSSKDQNFLRSLINKDTSERSLRESIQSFTESEYSSNKLSTIIYLKGLFENSIQILGFFGEVLFQAGPLNAVYYEKSNTFFTQLIELSNLKSDHYELSQAYLRLAQMQFIKRQYKDSLKLVHLFEKEFPLFIINDTQMRAMKFEASLLKAKLSIYFGQHKRIAKELVKCMSLFPQNEVPYLIFAFYLNFYKKSDSYEKYLQIGLNLTKNNKSELQFVLESLQAINNGKIQEGINRLEQCKNIFKNSELSYYILGNFFKKEKNFKTALKQYEIYERNVGRNMESYDQTPLSLKESLTCLCKIAKVRMHLEDYSSAIQTVEKCLKVDGRNSNGFKILLLIYNKQENIVQIASAVNSFDQSQITEPKIFEVLAFSYMLQCNVLQAILALKKCLSLDQNSPLIPLKIASIYSLVQNQQKALQFYLLHLSYWPNSLQALVHSSKLLIYFQKFSLAQTHINHIFEILKEQRSKGRIIIFKKCNKKYNSRQILENEELFEDQFISYFDAYKVLGYLQTQEKKYSSAEISYLKALEIEPDNVGVKLSLARVYSVLENYQEEINIYRTLMKDSNNNLIENSLKYLINIGNAQQKAGKISKAIKIFNQAISLAGIDTYKSDILANIAFCQIQKSNYDEALSLLRESLEFEKYHTKSLFLLGLTFEGLKQFPQAIDSYEQSIESNENYVPAYLSLASLKLKQNQLKEAIQITQTSLKHSPHDVRVQLFLGDLHSKSQDYWLALALFESILNSISQSEQSQFNKNIETSCNIQIAIIYQSLGQDEKAINRLQQCVEEYPKCWEYLFELGNLLKQLKRDLVKAVFYMKQASEACPSNPGYLFNLADGYMILNEYKLAVESFSKCLQLNPSFIEQVYSNLSFAYEQLNDKENVVKTFKNGIKIAQKPEILHLNYGNYLAQCNMKKKAAKQYERCLSINPINLEALNNLAQVSLHLKDYEKVLECYIRCLKINPDKNHRIYSHKISLLLKLTMPCKITQ